MSPLNTSDLNIDPDLRAWIDPLSPDEFAQLEANILADGCRDAIVVWGGYILDGHNRYEICKRHNVAFTTVEKTGLATKDDALIWMGEHQLGKRNLSDFSRTALALRLKPLMEQQARARMLAGRAPVADPVQISAQGNGKTRDELARKAGVSHDTVRKVEKILESGNAEVTAQVRAGEISINAAAKKVAPQRAQSAATPPAVSPSTVPAAAPAPVHDNSDAPDFGAVQVPSTILAKPAGEEMPVVYSEELDDACMPTPLGLLVAAQEKVEEKVKEVAELKARVAMLEQGDLASQLVAVERDRDGVRNRAADYFEKLAAANNKVIDYKKRLDRLRKLAGVATDGDLVEWVKSAARSTA